MTTKTPLLYLDTIKESIEYIIKYVNDKSVADYENDSLLSDAIHMRLQMLGESVSKLPVEFRDRYPMIPWSEIRALRNVISHDYAVIKPERVWKTIQVDLPPFLVQINQIIANLEKESFETISLD